MAERGERGERFAKRFRAVFRAGTGGDGTVEWKSHQHEVAAREGGGRDEQRRCSWIARIGGIAVAANGGHDAWVRSFTRISSSASRCSSRDFAHAASARSSSAFFLVPSDSPARLMHTF